jgi:integrase
VRWNARAHRETAFGKRVHFHGLRNSWAVENVRAGTPTNVVQKGLGHSSLKATSIYLDHVGTADLREAAAHDEGPSAE